MLEGKVNADMTAGLRRVPDLRALIWYVAMMWARTVCGHGHATVIM
jgi:hypothetical protein